MSTTKPSVISIIERWTNKAPAIILNPHDKIADTKMVKDQDSGEYMKFNDLLILLQRQVLIEMNPTVMGLIEDGNAHQALMKDLENLGYDDFDQVMTLLKEQRNTVLKEKDFEIWCEGWVDNGNRCYAFKVGDSKGYSFYDACVNYHASQDKDKVKDWRFENNRISIWSMSLYPTKEEAEKFLGKDPNEKN